MTKIKKVAPVSATSVSPSAYAEALSSLKNAVTAAQIRAASAVHKELVDLYWAIGKIITELQTAGSWEANFIEKLVLDLQNAFPGLSGFSRSNVFRMRALYLEYAKVAPSVRLLSEAEQLAVLTQIPWSHNIVLTEKIKDLEERLWYAHKTLENGWSRNILAMQIDAALHKRQGKAITNFARTLAAPQSDLAQQSLKDPYLFDFLTLREDYVERDIERGLIENVQNFLLELGKGFSFVGRQYHLTVSKKDYYLDLLFYHLKLRCFVVIELKTGEFEARDAGQINFYLSAVDDLLREPGDKPTIGLILCQNKDNFTAEYALRNLSSPIGIADYTMDMIKNLPKNLKSSLPTIEEFEAELEKQRRTKKRPMAKARPTSTSKR